MSMVHDLAQGSPEWLDFKRRMNSASEAAAMLGISPYVTRAELLRMKATGSPQEFSDWYRERVLDRGHEVEALAIPIAEEIIGDDLYPIVLSNQDAGGNLSVSCDGLTLDGRIAWEHKQYNESLAKSLRRGVLPEHHMAQCQQALMLTGAEWLLFMCSDGTRRNMETLRIDPDPAWFERIRSGWEQLDRDLAAYELPAAEAATVAEPAASLPAVMVRVEGRISIQENFKVFYVALRDFLDSRLIREPETDQDFADLDGQIKTLKKAEQALDAAEDMMLAQVSSIDQAKKQKAMLAELVRSNRIMAEKMLAREKTRRRDERLLAALRDFAAHVDALQSEITGLRLDAKAPDFAGAIKGLKTLSSIDAKLDAALANAKIEADRQAADLRAKIAWVDAEASEWRHLLADLQWLATKPIDDFQLAINARIEQHKREEQEREALIVREAEGRAMAKAMAEQQAAAEALQREREDKDREANKEACDAERNRGENSEKKMTDREFEIEAIVLRLRAMIELAREEKWEEIIASCADIEIDASRLARGEASDPMQDRKEPASPGRWADYWVGRSL